MFALLFVLLSLFVGNIECFGPRSIMGIRSASTAPRMASLSYKVTIVDGDVETVLDVDGDTTVLEAALEAGVELEYDCQMGVCLTCPSKVTCGKVSQDGGTLDDSVAAEGYALTCVSRPLEDCTIHVIPEDELSETPRQDPPVESEPPHEEKIPPYSDSAIRTPPPENHHIVIIRMS